MKVVLGFKSHSGWAAMVALGVDGADFEVIGRSRMELIDHGELWSKQPYHFAENRPSEEARQIVSNGIESAHSVALRQMRQAVSDTRKSKHAVAGIAVLVPDPMPDWNIDEILAVHFRMHKAEGILFPDALCRAARKCKLRLAIIREKDLNTTGKTAAGTSIEGLMRTVTKLGKSVGPPWGKDQKLAALAAMIALRENFG